MKVASVISGIGLVTPLGRTTEDTWQALLRGQAISDHARLEATLFSDVSRVASLGIEAAEQAIEQAGWKTQNKPTAIVCCTSKGPVDDWLGQSDPERASTFGLAGFSSAIARQTGFTDGPRLTLSAACASGLHGLIRAALLIQSGEASRVLVVAAEASVHPLFLASFKRLGVLPPVGALCRPFDLNRQGFLMSDAAAAICIEAAKPTDLPESSIVIERFAMGGDATHLTGSDPEGRVLRHLLQNTIGEQRVDFVHAHGTGTELNDQIELAALESMLPAGAQVPLFSHKAALGHSLGASGLVAVAISCLCHRSGLVPPNINTAHALPAIKLRIDRVVQQAQIRRSLIHAAGFGGPAAVVTLGSATNG